MLRKKRKKPVKDRTLILQEEQVVLAQERTASSFMRTGLAFVTAGIILMNAFSDNYVTVIFGWMLIGVGIVLLIQYAFRLSKYGRRIRKLDKKVNG